MRNSGSINGNSCFKKESSIMKKIYQNPEIKVVNVQTATMIAESTHSVGFGSSVSSASGAEARGGLWDDDEEE